MSPCKRANQICRFYSLARQIDMAISCVGCAVQQFEIIAFSSINWLPEYEVIQQSRSWISHDGKPSFDLNYAIEFR